MQIDLNADLGEGGAFDAELLEIVSSANISCGAHAGDEHTITRALQAAREHRVRVGAHPGYPDRANFGRRRMQLDTRMLTQTIRQQLEYLQQLADSHGMRLQHVKPHGALYNQAAQDPLLAKTLAGIIKDFDRRMILVALANSALLEAGRRAGLVVRAEAFADRRYNADGRLLPRSDPRALLHDPAEATRQSLSLVTQGVVTAADGSRLSIQADTLCLHGDNPEALLFARTLRKALTRAGVRIAAFD